MIITVFAARISDGSAVMKSVSKMDRSACFPTPIEPRSASRNEAKAGHVALYHSSLQRNDTDGADRNALTLGFVSVS